MVREGFDETSMSEFSLLVLYVNSLITHTELCVGLLPYSHRRLYPM